MFNYTPQNQLTIFDFKLDFESKLDPQNRWVKLAKLLDWDGLAKVYAETLCSNMGAKSIDARIVIGALIIKHLENKDDRGTIEMIRENPYMQFFLGFDHFHFDAPFDPSLFVHIRKRLGNDSFDKMNQIIIMQALGLENSQRKEDSDNQVDTKSEPQIITNQGKLQMDATVCDAHIKFPTDLGLLNDAREKSEEIIDKICEIQKLAKPRIYRRKARKDWLNLSKSKKNTKKKIREGIRKQLNYLKRNLKFIDKIVEENPAILSEIKKREYRYLLIINELKRQQEEMFQDRKHSIENRIVSIHQPHIRPIVRGKSGKNVEFGAKINISLQNGYARIDQMNFEAFNEGKYLIEQVENYKKLNGFYPELVQSDAIYMTKENRKFLKENNIRHTGKALGRKPKQALTKNQKQLQRIEKNERNQVEGKFGQGKAGYGLNKIKAQLATTSESWIASIMFVMNILKLMKDIFVSIIICKRNSIYRWFSFGNIFQNMQKIGEMKLA